MNRIYIKFMSDELVATLKKNLSTAVKYMNNNKIDSSWISNIYKGKRYIEKTVTIPDFTLKTSLNNNYKEVDYENSITLYESLKELPNYILSDERFWAWLNFEKCYDVALQAMPTENRVSTVRDHYLFNQNPRRALFFGVLSRCYFRVALTVDENRDDKYELTKFVVENPQRFRELSWRSFSSHNKIVRGVVGAEKDAIEKYGDQFKSSYYGSIAKYVSRIGSVKLLDALSEKDYYDYTSSYIENLIQEDNG
ncbi:MAG: DUF6339 family protein [Candidatus Izemoplasmataceae bacterium]